MNVLYFLIPISIIMLIIAIGGFFGAINSGQYDDLDRHARGILLDDANDSPLCQGSWYLKFKKKINQGVARF